MCLKAQLVWCRERSFVKANAEWIPYGEERVAALEGELKNRLFSKHPAPHPEPRPYNKVKPSILEPV